MATFRAEPDAAATPGRAGLRPVWLLWDCADLVAVFDTEADAYEARADLQHRLLCHYGTNLEFLETITVTTAQGPAVLAARARVVR